MPTVLLALILAGCVHMNTVTLLPVSTVDAVWNEVPADGLGHHLKVDEGVSTPDDAATYLSRVASGIDVEQLGVGGFPADFFRSVDVRLRARARANTFGEALGFLFLVNGVDIYGGNAPDDPGQFFDWSVLPLNTWSTLEFSLPSPFPTLRGTESIVIALVGTGTVIDVTAVELEIDYIPKAPRPRSVGDSRVPTADPAVAFPGASGHVTAPRASGSTLAGRSSGVAQLHVATGAVRFPAASRAGLVPTGRMADPGKPSALGMSRLPTAIATIRNPTASARVINKPTGSPE